MKHILLAAVFSILATLALAHSPVESTSPADAADLTAVPEMVNLIFVNSIRLTRIDMTHADHPTVELELGDQTSFATEFAVPVDGMGDGPYLIEWRGLGMDGHAMQGDFTFQVN